MEARSMNEEMDLADKLRLASEMLNHAADEIERLRSALDSSVKYGEKMRTEINRIQMREYS
jgi:lipid II:glycine glycyltransferase (peptidoglycan interpeptide bridge formation enzyme)